jgi:lipopolysaccharide transport system permease protein
MPRGGMPLPCARMSVSVVRTPSRAPSQRDWGYCPVRSTLGIATVPNVIYNDMTLSMGSKMPAKRNEKSISRSISLALMRDISVVTPQVYRRDATDPRHLKRAIQDMAGGLARWRLAVALARLDIRNRYRGSVLGPFWMTASTAILVVGLGLLYSTLFKMSLAEYLPWIAVSLVVWNIINQIVSEACHSLVQAEGVIRQLPLPYSVHVLRFVARNAIFAAHSLPLIAVVLLIFDAIPGPEALLAMPGILLIAVNACAAGLFLGVLCARFRDVPQIINNMMLLFFFLSPVVWKPHLLGEAAVWLPLNPFYVLMETVRGPLVEGGAAPMIWLAAIAYTVLASAGGFLFFVRFRARIAFWV